MSRRLTAAGFAVALLGGAASTSARAELIVTALPATAPQGGSGGFDVTVTNTGPDTVNLGGFQFELAIDSASGILFSEVTKDTMTVSYVFAAAPGPPPFSFDTFPNTRFLASDT